jgi:phospholipase/carboxylesterase
MVEDTELLESHTSLTSELLVRRGAPPRTSRLVPHIQLDQFPPPEIAEELLHRSLALPFVRSRQSRMASPRTRALWLPDICAAGPPDAFIDGGEFCHLHPLPDGTIHVTLPKGLRELAFHLGWAEPHAVTRIGCMPESLVLVYPPRNRAELDAVFSLIRGSYDFARAL